MAIYAPHPLVSQLEKDLLILLAKLILTENGEACSDNVGEDGIILSDEQARKLCDLLTEYAQTKRFIRGASFAEMVASSHRHEEDALRELYLSGLKEGGRARVLASRRWADFKARLGMAVTRLESDVRRMDPDHFVQMEVRLLRSLNVHPALEALVEDLVIRRTDIFERIERGDQVLELGQIRRSLAHTIRKLSTRLDGIVVSKTQLIGISTVVSDVTVMFSTRDWSVAGTLSAIAGGLAMCAPERQT